MPSQCSANCQSYMMIRSSWKDRSRSSSRSSRYRQVAAAVGPTCGEDPLWRASPLHRELLPES